jgi:DNA-binding LacI/PurR family transcriptional regulator
LAASTLFTAGASRYAVIFGDNSTTTNVDRVRGFTELLEERGVRNIPKSCGRYTYEGGYSAAKKLLKQKNAPDALFCVNDIMALGAIDAARELGRRVPEDLMIIGFDDIIEASRPAYQLTTIRQPIQQMIDEAMTMLTRPTIEPTSRILQGRLIKRATTREG